MVCARGGKPAGIAGDRGGADGRRQRQQGRATAPCGIWFPDGTRVLVAPANLGYAGGANLALEDWLATRTDGYCLIGSHDLHVAPDTMVTLVTTARRHPEFGILSCPISIGRAQRVMSTEK